MALEFIHSMSKPFRTRASAAFDLGRTEHPNGSIILDRVTSQFIRSQRSSITLAKTYSTNPDVTLYFTGTAAPFSSTAGLMSNTWSSEAMLMNNELSAKYLPGHTLDEAGSDQPQHPVRRTLSTYIPSAESIHHGSGIEHVFVQFPILQEATRIKGFRVRVMLRIVQNAPAGRGW